MQNSIVIRRRKFYTRDNRNKDQNQRERNKIRQSKPNVSSKSYKWEKKERKNGKIGWRVEYQWSLAGRVEFHRPPFLLSRVPHVAPWRNAAHRYVTDILVREENSRELTVVFYVRTTVPLSGEDERKTNRSSARLASFTFSSGITMLFYLHSLLRARAIRCVLVQLLNNERLA